MDESAMEQDRFNRLVEAYGAAPWRWPDAEREAATRFALSSPPAAETLERARALDEALDVWALGGAPAALRERIVVRAPGARPPLLRRPRFWWAGAGLAAACALGVVAGAITGPLLQPRGSDSIAALAMQNDNATAFGPAVDLGAGS